MKQAAAEVDYIVMLYGRLLRLKALDREFVEHFGYRSQMFVLCLRAMRLEYQDALRISA